MTKKPGRPAKYRFGEMEVGEERFIPGKSRVDIGGTVYYWAEKLNWVFSCTEAQRSGVPGALVRRVG